MSIKSAYWRYVDLKIIRIKNVEDALNLFLENDVSKLHDGSVHDGSVLVSARTIKF